MPILRGYRGLARELGRTGSWRALALQLRTGAVHVLRSMRRSRAGDPIAHFLASYGPDGFRLPDRHHARLQHAAEACLACGLCSVECARVGGAPALEPRDAVVAAARLEVDWVRLGVPPHAASGAEPLCARCRACEALCPVGIPIAGVQAMLAELGTRDEPAR
jgi:succinate dehydrogenase/fumarate reductase-like Fe-S protein